MCDLDSSSDFGPHTYKSAIVCLAQSVHSRQHCGWARIARCDIIHQSDRLVQVAEAESRLELPLH
jgi:hypothetical protein